MSKKTFAYAVPFLIFAALCVLLYQGLSMDPRLLPSALVDEPVPEFSLPSLTEPERVLGPADLKGKTRLLNVWGTWCPSCYAEHPYLLKLAKEQGVALIGLNYKDEPAKALDYLRRLGNPYEFVISDERGRLGIDLGVYGAPETFVLDANGVVRFRFVGVIDARAWEREFKPVLARLAGGQG